jgi:hypothetical protein
MLNSEKKMTALLVELLAIYNKYMADEMGNEFDIDQLQSGSGWKHSLTSWRKRYQMAVRVIKQGIVPEEVVYRTVCLGCDTEFEFLQKDGKVIDDQREGTYVNISCPTCGKMCSTKYMTPQQYARKKTENSGYYGHN